MDSNQEEEEEPPAGPSVKTMSEDVSGRTTKTVWSPIMYSGNHAPVPPEVLAIQHPLPPENLVPKSTPPGVITPRILKRKDHDYTSRASKAPSDASGGDEPDKDKEEMPWKQLSESTLKRRVCAVACCNAPFPPNVTFHRIPKTPALRKSWVSACKWKDKKFNPATSYVCSQHFKAEDMERDLQHELMNQEKRLKLKPGAVPSLALLPTMEIQGGGAAGSTAKTDRARRAEKKEQQNIISMLEEEDSDDCSFLPMDEDEDEGKNRNMSCQTVEIKCHEKGCQTENSLVKENLALKRRVKYLEAELRKARQRPELTEKDKVNVAKEVMSKSALTKQQVTHLIEDKQRTRWKSEDIVLGLTLRGLSKKGYKYLREKKLLPLPSLGTLRNHIRSFTCSPGIQEGILEGMHRFPSLCLHSSLKKNKLVINFLLPRSCQLLSLNQLLCLSQHLSSWKEILLSTFK